MSIRVTRFRKKIMQASQTKMDKMPRHEARVQAVPRPEFRLEVANRVVRHDKYAMNTEKLNRLLMAL